MQHFGSQCACPVVGEQWLADAAQQVQGNSIVLHQGAYQLSQILPDVWDVNGHVLSKLKDLIQPESNISQPQVSFPSQVIFSPLIFTKLFSEGIIMASIDLGC